MSLLGWIAAGLLGGLAAGARYLLDAEISRRIPCSLPLGILVVNTSGTFLLGLLAGAALDGEAMTVVAGGVLGSFTTFSTWMLDSRLLVVRRRAQLAWINIAVSLPAGMLAVSLGHAIAAG